MQTLRSDGDEAMNPPFRLPAVLVLGPCAIAPHEPGATAPELTNAQRAILARLALAGDDAVGLEALAAAVWGEDPPASSTAALHNQISRIRRQLGSSAVVTVAGGYTLRCPTDRAAVDRHLDAAVGALAAGDPASARAAAQRGLDSWRGTPLEELAELPEAVGERRRLDEVRRSLENLRLKAAIASSSQAWAVPEAERLVADTPFDEHRWVLLIQSLELAGRRGDALGAFERARRSLAQGLGLSPGAALLAAEAAVLRDPETRDEVGRVRFVGRAAVLDAALDGLDGGGALVLTGESGIGKSRLLDEAARRARNEGAVVGRGSVSWHPSSAVALLTDLCEDLGVDLAPGIPPVASFRSAVERRTDGSGALLLCVDDMDRAGPTSIAALAEVVRLGGVSLLATATEPALLPLWFEHAELLVPAMDDAEVAQLVATRTGADSADPSLVEWVSQMSGGNPTLVEYLLEHDAGPTHRSDQATSGSADGASAPVGSPAMRDLIRARLQRLGASSMAALEVAAVCGPRSSSEVLAQLVPWSGVEAGIASMLLDETVEADGRRSIAFRQGAVQRTLYGDLPPGRRTEIHHRAAEVLESLGAPPAIVAAHAVAAASLDPVGGARHAVDAALAATALGAHDDAATWYGRAIESAAVALDNGVPGADRARVAAMVGRGDALRLAGSNEQEAALFDAADGAFALGDPDLVGDAAFAVLQLGATTESGSLHAEAIQLADRALVVVTDPDQRARISAAASLTHSMTGATDRCHQLFLDAEQLATSDEARRQVLPFAYLGLGHPKDLAARERLTDELLRRGLDADDPVAMFEGHQLSFSIGLTRQDGRRVRSALAAQAALVVRVGDIGRRWQLAYQQAALCHLEGDLERAERRSEEALDLFGEVSPSRAFAVYGAQLLPIRIAEDRLGELLDTFESLVTEQPGVPAWHAALALGLAASDPARASEHAAAALHDVAEDFTWLAAHMIGGRAAAAVGDPELCDAYDLRLAPWSGLGCWQGTCSYGPVDTVLAQLATASGRHDDAGRLAASAMEQCDRLGAPVFSDELHRMRIGQR